MPEIYQDWTPVILNKSKINNKSKIQSVNNNNNNNNNEDNDIIKIKLITKEYGIKMQQRRQELKLSQEDVAKALYLNINIIKDYEKGTAIHNGNIITKINRYLKISK
jgi:ribosome-binding protein aMBF1 (putative translation factor)